MRKEGKKGRIREEGRKKEWRKGRMKLRMKEGIDGGSERGGGGGGEGMME